MAPMNPQLHQEMQDLEQLHSRSICGIVAHVKDRYIQA